jgi:hypothetical protein
MRKYSTRRREQRQTVRLRVLSNIATGSAQSDVLRQCGVRGTGSPAGNPVQGDGVRRMEHRGHIVHPGMCNM